MDRILCVGDGFAHGHIWPEWPQILQAMIPSRTTELVSGIGAGNEFLVSGLLDQEPNKDLVIFQWAQADRFDKIVQDQDWEDLARSDPVYGENFYDRAGDRWWLSSASGLKEIQHYHRYFVQTRQSLRRLRDQQKLVEGFLISRGCEYVAVSTLEQHMFSREDRFHSMRGNEIQPSPPVHLAYLEEIILPRLSIDIDSSRTNRLKQALNNIEWQPYHPDRAEIWREIVSGLDTG